MGTEIEIAESELEQISSPAQNCMSLAAKSAISSTLSEGKTFLATTIGATLSPPSLQMLVCFARIRVGIPGA
jgi:hypothetical protein